METCRGAARGKFVSSAKVLTAVPSISQQRRVYRALHQNKDRFETGEARKELSTKNEIQSCGRVMRSGFWNSE